MTNLFAQKAQPDYGAAEGVLVVVRHKSRPGAWSVVQYGTDVAVRSYDSEAAAWYHACWSPLHSTDTLPKVTDGGWFYSRGGKGFTSDPRFAETKPASKLDGKRREIDRAIVRFIRAKVGSMDPLEAFLPGDIAPTTLSEAEGVEDFDALVREIEAETPVETPDNPSESPSGAPEGDGPSGEPEAVEGDSEAFDRMAAYVAQDQAQVDSLNGSLSAFYDDHEEEYATDPEYRAAFNFHDLALNAPSPEARAYWQARVEAL